MAGQIPLDLDFVRAVPDLARKYGTVWHMDEVVTGFRDRVGGYQELAGVRPDLTSLGKIVAGGLGAGALVGRAEIMQFFSPETPEEKHVIHTGTWNANPLTCAAGAATLRVVGDGTPQKRANERAAYLRQRGNEVLRKKGVSGRLYGRSVTHLYLGPIDFEPDDETIPPTPDTERIMGMVETKERLGHHLLHRGVSVLHGYMFVLSSAHTEEDIERTVVALDEAVEAMIEEGTLENPPPSS